MPVIKEVDDIFNTKLDKEHYSNFREVYSHLLYDSVGRIKLFRDIDKTLLYADMQLRLSFDSDLSDIGFAKKIALILNGVTSRPICHCGNIIKYSNSGNGLYNNGCSNICLTIVGRAKAKQTNLERYGVENPFQSREVQDKMKQTNLERYGVENASRCQEIKDKKKQTNLEHYGVEYSLQCKEIRENIKQTNLERYGVEIAMQSKQVQEKSKQTNLERYGVEYSLQRKEIRENIKQTYLENHIDSIWETILSNTHCRPLFSKAEYIGSSYDTSYNWECTNCNHHYDSYYYGGYVKACPTCTKSRSMGEIELYNYIQSLIPDVEVLSNDYTIIPPKELDIYIPSLNLAFEYNGDYWHSLKEDGYHESKTEGCLDKNIQLHHIWESAWIQNQDETKELISKIIKNFSSSVINK